jgi:hypothetical protein
MSKKLFVISFLTLMIASTAIAQEASPPRNSLAQAPAVQQRIARPANTVTAIIVKSWGNNPVWADLNANWSTYGTIPVSVDYTTLIDSDFTYQDLVSSNADVIILSDPAGGVKQYSSTEVDALAEYVEAGHPILATYATFQYSPANIDNRALAPLFGLSSTLTYTTATIDNEFTQVAKACLFNKIPSTWTSNGFNNSQVPASGSWTGNLGKAKAGAQSDSYVGVISGFHKNKVISIYVSNMPEYNTIGGDDEQLLYNAISCYAR